MNRSRLPASLRSRRFGLLAAALAALAGCQHGQPRGPDLAAGSRSAPKVTAKSAADVQVAVARSLEARGELAQAASLYQDALKQDPRRADAWLRLAIVRDQQGKFADSAECYRKALAARPGSPDIYCNMGYSCYLQQRWGDAEMNLRQALALNPDHRRAHNNLGLVLAHTGRAGEALAQFRNAGCSESEAYSNLAFVMTLERRWPEARLHYDNALASDPVAAPSIRKRLQQLDDLVARVQRPADPKATVQQASHQAPAAAPETGVTPAVHVEPAPRGANQPGTPDAPR